MAAITTNLASTATNLAFSGTNLVSATTNLSPVFTNAAGTVSGGGVEPTYCTVIWLMALGVLLGSLGLFCYQRAILKSETAKDKWEFPKILGMGIAAVALVPAFLRTVSSNLVKETETSFEARLVLVAFCVAATMAAKKFIGTLPEQLLNLADKTAAQAAETQKNLQIVAEVVADRTGKPPPEPKVNDGEEKTVSPVTGYDWKGEFVIRALLNPKYPAGRTVAGLAFDTGLTVTGVHDYLRQLDKNGDAQIFAGHPNKGPLWHLTTLGHQKFANHKWDESGGSMVEVGIQ